jgi:hypothetical protein
VYSLDIDNDGIPNEWDEDIDGDGTVNELDIEPLDPNSAYDIDGDGDGDGIDSINVETVTIESEQVYSIEAGDIIRFVPVMLVNGGELTMASAFIGRASVVDNNIIYHSALDLPQQMYIEYEVKLPDGQVTREYVLLVNESANDGNKPIFRDVEPIDIQATNLFTPIIGLAPDAYDALGNPVPVSLKSQEARLRPGNHVVYWSGTDENTGATQLSAQLFRVHPLVDFGQGSLVYEGAQARFTVHLNGVSPVYPLTVPVTIDMSLSTSSDNDHSLLTVQDVVMSSGREAEVLFDVSADDIFEGEETIELGFDNSVNTGPIDSLTLKIQESEPVPVMNARVVNSAGEVQSIVSNSSNEPLYLDIRMLSAQVPLQLTWSYSTDFTTRTVLGVTDNNVQLLLDVPLSVGRNRFYVEGVNLGSDMPPVNASVDIRVIETIRLSMDQDSDNDGVSDLAEGMVDTDGDLIPDYLDAVNSCELQVIDNDLAQKNGGYVLQSSAGSCIKLGRVSEDANTYSPYVSGGNAAEMSTTPVDEDYVNIFNTSQLSNFVITNVHDRSVRLVLPLLRPYSEGGVFRKHTSTLGWFDFDTAEVGSDIRYAMGELGFCPPPGADEYQQEPIIGANCLEMTIQDGGVHDADGERNGKIDDPGYMAYVDEQPNFDDIVINYEYEPSVTGVHEVSFNVCDYLDLSSCNVTLLSVGTTLGLTYTIDGTTVNLMVPRGVDSVSGQISFTLDGRTSSVEMNVILTPMESRYVKGGGSVSTWLLGLLTMLQLIRIITSRKQIGSTRLCVECLKSSHSRSKASHTSGIHE